MPEWPDAGAVVSALARAGRRRALVRALAGASAGVALATIVSLALWLDRMANGGNALSLWRLTLLAAALTAGGAAAGRLAARRSRIQLAYDVERRAGCRNLVVTTAELLESPDRVRPEIGARVCRDAARTLRGLDLAQLFPVRRATGALALLVVVWTGVTAGAAGIATAPGPTRLGDGTGPAGASIADVTIDVAPPGYARQPSTSMRDPERIDVLAGSRLRIGVRADAAAVVAETIDGTRTLERDPTGLFVTDLSADRDGYIALEPASPGGVPGPRRLIGLVARPDLAPRVRVIAPGQDLFLPDATMRLQVGVEASDDLALASLALTYTKVSGSGENFEFLAGEVPLAVSRATDRAWTATGVLVLGDLDLEPGDMVVYRGVAADRRPGAPPVESDAFIVEILAPGEAAAGGFAIDDQRERYALSQRMVIVKTERLQAARAALSADAVAEEATRIAAEQRQVRAEFVFMMGGELSELDPTSDPFVLHEEEEAHGESDIAAGRLANQGRVELTRAVRAMSLAATLLASADLPEALTAERAALDALQRAFSKSRYILRTLSERQRIDLERRLTGALDGTARGPLPSSTPEPDARIEMLTRALAGVVALGGAGLTRDDASRAIALAQMVVAIDPSSEALRGVMLSLADAARALERDDVAGARTLLDGASAALAGVARTGVAAGPAASSGPATDQLRGAQADVLRARGGGR